MSASDNKIVFSPDFAIYSPKPQGIYPLRESDWKRLKRLISQITPHRRIYEVLASVFLAIAGSAFLSLLAFLSTPSLYSWIIPTNVLFIVIPLILGIVFICLDRQQKEFIRHSVQDVQVEMDAIEQEYDKQKRAVADTPIV